MQGKPANDGMSRYFQRYTVQLNMADNVTYRGHISGHVYSFTRHFPVYCHLFMLAIRVIKSNGLGLAIYLKFI
jgi:hypothetical protein